MGVGDGEVLYVGTGVEAGVPAAVGVGVRLAAELGVDVPAAVGVGVMVAAELGVGVPAAVGVCVMVATELLLRFPYPEPAQEKCEKWSRKI